MGEPPNTSLEELGQTEMENDPFHLELSRFVRGKLPDVMIIPILLEN